MNLAIIKNRIVIIIKIIFMIISEIFSKNFLVKKLYWIPVNVLLKNMESLYNHFCRIKYLTIIEINCQMVHINLYQLLCLFNRS